MDGAESINSKHVWPLSLWLIGMCGMSIFRSQMFFKKTFESKSESKWLRGSTSAYECMRMSQIAYECLRRCHSNGFWMTSNELPYKLSIPLRNWEIRFQSIRSIGIEFLNFFETLRSFKNFTRTPLGHHSSSTQYYESVVKSTQSSPLSS